MEYSTRQDASVRLVTRLIVLFAIAAVFTITACKSDAPSTGEAPISSPANNTTAASQSPGTVIDENGVPSMINGKRVTSVKQVEGGIEPYAGDNPTEDGRKTAIAEMNADVTGFAGVSPCEVITPQDFEEWPGGIGQASSERRNMGEIILGCITTFKKDESRPGGTISVFFSDNQTAELAAESVQLMPETSKGNAKLIDDWDKPAAYDTTTGEFAWAHNQVFIVLIISHPSVVKDNLKWCKKLASAIEARMP